MTLLNVLSVLGVLNVLDMLDMLNMPKDASFACWALFFSYPAQVYIRLDEDQIQQSVYAVTRNVVRVKLLTCQKI